MGNIRRGIILKIDRDELDYGRYVVVSYNFFYLSYNFNARIGDIQDILLWSSICLFFSNFSTSFVVEK